MLHEFRFRMPLWVAVALVAAIYAARSALRGFDFRPDLPGDAVVLALFVAVLVIVAYVRAKANAEDDDGIARSDDDPRSPGGPHEPSGGAGN